MPVFGPKSRAQLETLHPDLQLILNIAIKSIDFVIIEGFRDEEDQNRAFAEGKSKLKWPNGKHNSFPSRAVDIWPYVLGPKIDWKDVPAAARLMGYIQRVAEELGIKVRFGLDWDGDWRTAGLDPNEKFLDAPHLELVVV